MPCSQHLPIKFFYFFFFKKMNKPQILLLLKINISELKNKNDLKIFGLTKNLIVNVIHGFIRFSFDILKMDELI